MTYIPAIDLEKYLSMTREQRLVYNAEQNLYRDGNDRTNGGRIFKDGKFYRKRRGKLVEIPMAWVGNVTTPQTIARRKSKKGQGRRFRRKVAR